MRGVTYTEITSNIRDILYIGIQIPQTNLMQKNNLHSFTHGRNTFKQPTLGRETLFSNSRDDSLPNDSHPLVQNMLFRSAPPEPEDRDKEGFYPKD